MAVAPGALILLVATLSAGEPSVQVREEVVFADPARAGATVPARVFYRDGSDVCPVVVFSHDLGRSSGAYWWLGESWAHAGYTVVFPTHAGSDRRLVEGRRPFAAMAAVRDAAADAAVWAVRPRDVRTVVDGLDQLEAQVPALRGRVRRDRVGVGGQSLGAYGALAAAGLRPSIEGVRGDLRLAVVAACLALSPFGLDHRHDAEAWAGVRVPVLFMVGGRDDQPAGRDTPAHPAVWREDGFFLVPSGLAWLIRLPAAHHFTFSNGGWGPEVDPRHTAAIAAASTAFWDHWLRGIMADPLAAVPAALGEGIRR